MDPLPKAGVELEVGSNVVRIVGEKSRDAASMTCDVENKTTGVRQLLKIPAPTEDEAVRHERQESLTKERSIMRLLNRIEQVPAGGKRHIPLVDPANSASLMIDDEPVEYAAILMDAPSGENVGALLQTGHGLDEALGLHIAGQLADVVGLAHLANVQCVALVPERLYWDGHFLVMVGWHQTRDMTELSDPDQAIGKQEDRRSLAALIFWIVTGQPVPDSGLIDPLVSTISPPLRKLLERTIHFPAGMGENPLADFKAEIVRLHGYWQADNAFAHVEQDIQETGREIQFLAESSSPRSFAAKVDSVRKIDHLYEQIAIGRLKEAEHPWHDLEQSLNGLWADQLALMVKEIAAGRFDVALDLVKSTAAYPQEVHRPLLWRRRMAEACQADMRLARECDRAGRVLSEWDLGNYNLSLWVSIDQKLFDSFNHAAREAITCLQAELRIAALVDQYEQTPADRVDERLNLIGRLDKTLSEGIDPLLAEARQRVCQERPLLEEQQHRAARVALFRRSLNDLEQRVQGNDATLVEGDFDRVLAESSFAEERRAVSILRMVWRQSAEIRQWLEDGDIARAVQHYSAMGQVPEVLLAGLQRQIAHATLRMVGLKPDVEISFGEAFDRMLDQPVNTPGELEQLLDMAGVLLPVIDTARRQRYHELWSSKERAIAYLETISDEQSSFETRLRAFQDLQTLGICFLHDKLLGDAYGGYTVAQHRLRLEQLEAVAAQLQSDIQSLQKYEAIAEQVQSEVQSLRSQSQATPSHFLEREVAEIETLMPSKEAQHRHHQIWESTAGLAKTFQTMNAQRDFFDAMGLINIFRQRCPDTIHETLLQMNQQEFDSLIALATEIRVLATRLKLTHYASTLNQFVEEHHAWMNESLMELLSFDPRKDEVMTQAERLVTARRLLVIFDALGGTDRDRALWEQFDFQHELVSTYLRHPNVSVRRAMLRHLSPEADESSVLQALEKPAPSKRWPMPAYAVSGALLLVVIGLAIVLARGLLAGGWGSNTAMSAQDTAIALSLQNTATAPTTPGTGADDEAEDGPTQDPTALPSLMALDSFDVSPTPSPEQPPDLNLHSSTGTIELYQGESARITLTVTDQNNSAEEAVLEWSQLPDGVTIKGDRNVSIEPNGTVVQIEFVVDGNAADTSQTVRFSVSVPGAAAMAEAEVYLIVHELPEVMKEVLAVNEAIQESLALTVTQNVTLRDEPIIAPETQIQVLPVDTPLTILQLEPQYGFINVQARIKDQTLEGWVSTQRNFTTYDPQAIPLEQYPLQLIVGNAENEGNQAALHTSDARDESDMQMVAPQEAELLNVVPLFDPDEDRFWVRVRLLGAETLEGWMPMEDTNFEEVMAELAAQIETTGGE